MYSRSGNPTRKVLETCLAALESSKHALTFSSGLASITMIGSLLKTGDHLISGDDLYGGTNRYFQRCLQKQNITISFVDTTKVENVIDAIRPSTKVRKRLKMLDSCVKILFCFKV